MRVRKYHLTPWSRWMFVILLILISGGYYLISVYHEQNRFAVNKNIDLKTYSIDSQILNVPAWVADKSYGLHRDLPRDVPLAFEPLELGAADKEEEFSWTHFFSGTSNGLVLELGAVDGHDYSVSRFYETRAGWKTVLIEASPEALKIPKNRPNALSLQLAVCETESIVHFSHGEDWVGGILEFMSPQFLIRYHSKVLKDGLTGKETDFKQMVDWDKVARANSVAKQPCLPLQSVLDRFHITHINFLVLDLEGGELAALKSLNFTRISFDVMCVETNRFNNTQDPYIDQVVTFLEGKGYALYQRSNGRNSWFLSPTWKKP